MSIFHIATVLIYVTSVLTSTVNDSSSPDRSPPSNLETLFASSQTESKDHTVLTDTRSVNDNGSTDVSKSGIKEQIFTEGGRVIPSSRKVDTKSSTKAPLVNEHVSLPAVKLPPSREISGFHEGGKGIVPRKGVVDNKTVGKKGVQYPEDFTTEKSFTVDQGSQEENLPNVKKTATTDKPVVKTETIPPVKENEDAKIPPNDIKLDDKTEIVGNRTAGVVILVPGKLNNTVTPKRKPTFTTGEGDDDGKGMPSSPTQADIGMPRKVDYIIPVVITIMATPVLGIAAFVLYTRGKDCWEKRHYRRMDFLIDGMYND